MIAPWITVDDLDDPASSDYAEEAIDVGVVRAVRCCPAASTAGSAPITEVYCQIGLDQIGSTVLPATIGLPLPGPAATQVYPELRDGVITNRIGGCCSTCGCTHLIRLRGGPVAPVESVDDRRAARWTR